MTWYGPPYSRKAGGPNCGCCPEPPLPPPPDCIAYTEGFLTTPTEPGWSISGGTFGPSGMTLPPGATASKTNASWYAIQFTLNAIGSGTGFTFLTGSYEVRGSLAPSGFSMLIEVYDDLGKLWQWYEVATGSSFVISRSVLDQAIPGVFGGLGLRLGNSVDSMIGQAMAADQSASSAEFPVFNFTNTGTVDLVISEYVEGQDFTQADSNGIATCFNVWSRIDGPCQWAAYQPPDWYRIDILSWVTDSGGPCICTVYERSYFVQVDDVTCINFATVSPVEPGCGDFTAPGPSGVNVSVDTRVAGIWTLVMDFVDAEGDCCNSMKMDLSFPPVVNFNAYETWKNLAATWAINLNGCELSNCYSGSEETCWEQEGPPDVSTVTYERSPVP